MGINASNLQLKDEQQRRQLNSLLKTQGQKKGFRTGAIIFNIVGGLFTGIGSYATIVNWNSEPIFGIVPLSFGLGFTGASIPLHLKANSKKQQQEQAFQKIKFF